jgi:hypothetical protein
VLLTVPIAAVSLAVRFRRARGLERQQLRWLAFAAGLASVGAVLVLAGTSLPTSTATTLALITWGAGLCLGPAPLAIGAAILRSRLLTWTRSAAARSPTGCSRCCWPAAMPASSLDSADSWTRVQPGGRRRHPGCGGALPAGPRGIQALVDRRFNRRRYDTARIIATFSTRLRDQVDLTTLTGELLAVVNQTVQPTRTSLWLRPQGAAGATDGTAAHRFLSRR